MAAKRVRISDKPMSNPRADAWVRHRSSDETGASMKTELYKARLTIDVTLALRARIKVAAFKRGVTVAELLRELLNKAFPENPGEAHL